MIPCPASRLFYRSIGNLGLQFFQLEMTGQLSDQTWIQILRSSLPLGLEKVLTFIPQLIAQWEFSANQRADERGRGQEKDSMGTNTDQTTVCRPSLDPLGRRATLRSEIESAINRTSAENGSDTPDWILAGYLTSCLDAFDAATCAREKWYGRGENIDGKPPGEESTLPDMLGGKRS